MLGMHGDIREFAQHLFVCGDKLYARCFCQSDILTVVSLQPEPDARARTSADETP